MRTLAFMGVAAIACAVAFPATAGGYVASLEAGTEREPDDFSRPLLNYDNATLGGTFNNGFGWILFAQNGRLADGSATSWAFEAMAGYRFAYSPRLSFYASGGAGERLTEARDFPYFTVRGGMDVALGNRFTWNALNLRYREGMDGDFEYRASVAGTGVSYRIDEDWGAFARVFAAFDTQYRFAGTGLGVGLRRYF